MTPSVHLGVPESFAVTPGRGRGIGQHLGWEDGVWVREFGGSGWSPGGHALASIPGHFSVDWTRQGTCSTAWETARHACLFAYQHGQGAAVGPQLDDPFGTES